MTTNSAATSTNGLPLAAPEGERRYSAQSISVIIPTRLAAVNPDHPAPPRFIDRAIASVRRQTVWAHSLRMRIVVAVDPGRSAEARLCLPADVVAVEGDRMSQSLALNAALGAVDGDVVAILEDDDLWHPEYLDTSMRLLEEAAFVSSTQLAVWPDGAIANVFDFPTPSGWVMRRETLLRVGRFNEDFRWHLDNEWLGRLAASRLPRVHLVEATAPIHRQLVEECRPILDQVVRHGGPSSRLYRHRLPWPMVQRTLHPNSGMAQIMRDPAKRADSRREHDRLIAQYGHLPH